MYIIHMIIVDLAPARSHALNMLTLGCKQFVEFMTYFLRYKSRFLIKFIITFHNPDLSPNKLGGKVMEMSNLGK